MKSTLLSVLFVALMVVGLGCASNSGGSTGTGGASGSGGTSSAGGSTSSGGSGGDKGTGGAAGSGGTQQSGGSKGTGGTQGTGGASGEGGKQGTGGAESTGGKLGTGGTRATGGTQGTGGAAGTGGGSASDAGRDVPAKDDALSSDAAAPKDVQGSTSDGGVIRTRQIKTRGFTFDVLEAGPEDGEPVLLLHGFPEISLEWSGLMPVLAAAGYHCLAPDQRGYSPGARPTEVSAYKYEELVADAFAIASELGERFHLVAHDWGANIAWLMLQKDPSRIASYTSLAVPHYQVWAKAVYDTSSDLNKIYLPMLTTWMTPGDGEAYWTASAMRSMWKKKPADQVEQTITHMLEPGCMTAALNWYRASDGHKSVINDFQPWTVDVPTLLIFGSTDIGQKTVTDSKPLVTNQRVVQPSGGHFIVDEQPKVVADETLVHLKAYPIK